MTADLAKYTDLHVFAQAYPERFFQMGMAEQLLIGAAGRHGQGRLHCPSPPPTPCSPSRRAYDFIHQVIAEENLNVKIACALPGLTTGYGPSHQATEDLAMMRGIPGLTIIDPCDALDIEQAVPAIAEHRARSTCACCAASVPLVLDEYGYRVRARQGARCCATARDVLVVSRA